MSKIFMTKKEMKFPQFDHKKQVDLSPHVVILGAGATKACILNGDKNGIESPVMDDLIDTIGLQKILISNGIKNPNRNFEEVYNEIYSDPDKKELVGLIKSKVSKYFAKLEILDELTIYDKLILSLRKKDLIATFNWDPLLIQAYRRHLIYKDQLPKLVFLHGNVAVGFCKIDNCIGYIESACQKCGNLLDPVELLYPIMDKDYDKNPFIKNEWVELRNHLHKALIITIFGYGAPDTDAVAIKTMKEIWDMNRKKIFLELEIIDIKSKDKLLDKWKEFKFSHHYEIYNKFDDCYIARFPRRSCDAYATLKLKGKAIPQNPIPENLTLKEFQNWLDPLFNEEVEHDLNNTGFNFLPI